MPAIILSELYTRSTYTLGDAIDRVLGDLGLRNNNIITSGDITRWMNEAQTIIARDTRAFHVTKTIDTVSGTAEYQFPDDAASKVLAFEELRYGTTPLPLLSINQLYAIDPYWRTATAGTPLGWYVRGMSCVGLYPAPDVTSGGAVTLVATALPPQVTATGDVYYVPNGCEDALILYSKLQASVKDSFGEGAKRMEYYDREWRAAYGRAMAVASMTSNEYVCLGANGLVSPRSWYYVSSSTVATPRS